MRATPPARRLRLPTAALDTTDPILADPNEAYRTEVMQALKDAMLAHSSSLGIGPNEWLTIAAKGNDDRPRLAPADTGSTHADDPASRIGSDRVPGRPDHARRSAEADLEVRMF